jgi:hypothetical protein
MGRGPGGPPRGPGGPRPAPRAPQAAAGGKVDKLHLDAAEFARNFSIPEAVAFQIVRGDFTLKEWMEKHAEAERKRKERDKVQAVKKQQRARDEGMAQQYFLKQKRNETPLLLRMHGGTEIEGPIRSILPYHFWIDVAVPEGGEPKREKIEKLNVVMCYKKENAAEVVAGLAKDETVAALDIQPVREKESRYEVPLAVVQKAAQDNLPLRAILNEGTVVEGTIDWYSSYFIKVKLSTGASVVVFNHGVHKLDIAEVHAGRK